MNASQPSALRKILKPRRLTLLASAAVLGVAVVAAGPGHFNPMNLVGFTQTAQAAENPNDVK